MLWKFSNLNTNEPNQRPDYNPEYSEMLIMWHFGLHKLLIVLFMEVFKFKVKVTNIV